MKQKNLCIFKETLNSVQKNHQVSFFHKHRKQNIVTVSTYRVLWSCMFFSRRVPTKHNTINSIRWNTFCKHTQQASLAVSMWLMPKDADENFVVQKNGLEPPEISWYISQNIKFLHYLTALSKLHFNCHKTHHCIITDITPRCKIKAQTNYSSFLSPTNDYPCAKVSKVNHQRTIC